MKMRSVRSVLPALLAATVLTATAGAASAETLTVKDSTHDVWRDDYSGTTETFTQVGTHVNTDLRRTVVRHTADRVVVRATYVDLRRTGPWLALYFRVRTNEGLRRDAGVDTVGNAGGTQHLTRPNRSKELACAGMTHQVDYANEQVVVSIPRSCLSNPRWVQVTVGALSVRRDGEVSWVDNGQDASHRDPSLHPTWSARIHRG